MSSKPELAIYLDWLDEVRTLIARHGCDAVEAWQAVVPAADLAHELRAIAGDLDERATELRDIADAVEHEARRTVQAAGV